MTNRQLEKQPQINTALRKWTTHKNTGQLLTTEFVLGVPSAESETSDKHFYLLKVRKHEQEIRQSVTEEMQTLSY